MPREAPQNHYRLPDIVDNPKLYVIAAEGSKTEREYFNTLKDEYSKKFNRKNIHLEILKRPAAQKNNSSPKFIEKMLDDFLEDNQDYNFQEYDELWLIIDTDSWELEEIRQIAERCQNDPLYYLGLNNPCFELWLILHLTDSESNVRTFVTDNNLPLIGRCIENSDNSNTVLSIKNCIESIRGRQRSKICKQLLNIVRQHYRANSYAKLIDNIPEAIPRAKILSECDPSSNNYPENICTSVYKLLETLAQ